MKFENDKSILQQKMSASYVGISRRQAMIKALNISKGDKILDIGCGGGHLIEDIAKSVGQEGKARGERARRGGQGAVHEQCEAESNCRPRQDHYDPQPGWCRCAHRHWLRD